MTLNMASCESDIISACDSVLDPPPKGQTPLETEVEICHDDWKVLDLGVKGCQGRPTTDCDCYNRMVPLKDSFKKKCFSTQSPGLYKYKKIEFEAYLAWHMYRYFP